ncbi:cytochrome P450 [Cryptosporangium aurantiacum]|uniref:Cytochrome P450 n=1 Tax=Cryptosporangium aurantiacum TaxID=134849 RepID=A0A1M7RBT1_9ACTN|nr:cytochrome P450 [Cryptosporangium aurantiacum]SHN43592.1 Cytochrome P450 [Cryptosporangium aurantiacum]
MSTVSATAREYDPIDISSLDFWSTTAVDRERTFAVLREQRPVSWHPMPESGLLDQPDDPGFWAVVRHADIVEVSRRNDVFVSGRGVMFGNVPEELLEMSQSFLAMDPPRHTTIRKLVSAAFTARQIARIEDQIAANARAIVAELTERLAAGGDVDFVTHCASKLPIRTLAQMMGIPESDWDAVVTHANTLVSVADPQFLGDRDPIAVLLESLFALHQEAQELAARRRVEPRDDLMTALVQAEVDGARLTDAEIAAFFVLLSVAGNDTTRQTTSHAMRALTLFPEQREWLLADFDARIGGAVEEFVRWASPVMTFRRTASAPFVLHGQEVAAGDKVVMFYASGNWDTAVFDAPDRFNLARKPNPHVAFGGGGAHYCLGSNVAKVQLRCLFRELLHQLPTLRAGEPEYVAGAFIHAVRTMPCEL